MSQPKRQCHQNLINKLKDTDPARAKELESLSSKLISKHDYRDISASNLRELSDCLDGLRLRMNTSEGCPGLKEWIDDLTEQVRKMKARLGADEEEIRMFEMRYRDVFYGRAFGV